MNTSEVNIPLLRKAVEWAEAEAAKPVTDREWNQWRWLSTPLDMAIEALEDTPYEWEEDIAPQIAPYCGTAYCIAGWVAQSVDPRYSAASEVNGVHSSLFAAKALGIAPDSVGRYSANALFSANNTIEDVRRIAEEIAGERL